ncbi:hypothetical protein [Bacillus subtilis]|uniref:hypothetical protein n=1 Tax=Bacillus subtilis TaxID=1423 RepID=UPI0016433473|nr:hypothetical protein [Bacillus subtilis]
MKEDDVGIDGKSGGNGERVFLWGRERVWIVIWVLKEREFGEEVVRFVVWRVFCLFF